MSNTAVSIAALTTIAFTCVALGYAINEPLFKVADLYDVHLFPEDDELNYRVSNVHRAAQNLHIATLFFAIVSGIMMLAGTITNFYDAVSARYVKITAAAMSILTTLLYICAVITLSVAGHRLKKRVEDLPIPIPNLHFETQIGGIMEVVGVFAAMISSALVMGSIERQTTGFMALP